jgi:hypothetical protein
LACKLHHLRERLDGRALAVWGAGRDGRRLVRALRDAGYVPRAFIDIDPRKIGRQRLQLPVLAPDALAGHRISPSLPGGDPLILAAVGTQGARELIRTRLNSMGWRELEDYFCLH